MRRNHAIIPILLTAMFILSSPIASIAVANDLNPLPKNAAVIYVGNPYEDVSEAVCEALSDPSVPGVFVIDQNLIEERYANSDSGDLATGTGYTLKNRQYKGVLTGATRLATAAGMPGITVGISQTKSVANSNSCSVPIAMNQLDACVGFKSSASEDITISGSSAVPDRVGAREVSSMTVIANPVYDYYSYDIYRGGTFIDRGFAKHAVGVYFWRRYAYR